MWEGGTTGDKLGEEGRVTASREGNKISLEGEGERGEENRNISCPS